MAAPPDPVKEVVREICLATGLHEGVVEAMMGDLAQLKDAPPGRRYSMRQLAERYGVAHSEMATVQGMSKVVMGDVRDGLISKLVTIGNKATDMLMDQLNNPEIASKIKPADMARIAKTQFDAARDLSGGGGQGTTINFNLGDVQQLKKATEVFASRPSLEDQLREMGKLKDVDEPA